MEKKFRAFRPSFGDHSEDVMTRPFTLGNLQDQDQFDFEDGGYVGWDEFGLLHEDTILMQYTGLKDKNGVEIYEGDLIAPKHYPFYGDAPEMKDGRENPVELNYVGEVFYQEEDAVFAHQLHVVSDRVSGRACGGALFDLTDIEVIGNIHENPDLI